MQKKHDFFFFGVRILLEDKQNKTIVLAHSHTHSHVVGAERRMLISVGVCWIKCPLAARKDRFVLSSVVFYYYFYDFEQFWMGASDSAEAEQVLLRSGENTANALSLFWHCRLRLWWDDWNLSGEAFDLDIITRNNHILSMFDEAVIQLNEF